MSPWQIVAKQQTLLEETSSRQVRINHGEAS